MALYTIHEPPTESGDAASRAEDVTFVREGFAWLAVILGPLWLIWHRLWWPLAGWLLGLVAVCAVLSVLGVSDQAIGWMPLLSVLLLGAMGNELLRRQLEHRGFTEVATIAGDSLADCEARYFLRRPSGS